MNDNLSAPIVFNGTYWMVYQDNGWVRIDTAMKEKYETEVKFDE
jgi:hypothetical protein